jgi:hypothetical protein
MAIEIQRAIAGQYRAGLRMLRQSIERCPDDLWCAVADKHPRTFWRIAYHTVYYTHMYLHPKLEDFVEWERHVAHAPILWDDDEDGVPPDETPYSQADLIDYLDLVDSDLDRLVNQIDFESLNSGFDWYKIPKLDHQLVTLRHLGIHIGQLQELIYARGIELDWMR